MARSAVVIENPVLNFPFVEPKRHFVFDDEGITDQIAETRRSSSYFIPIPPPKKKGSSSRSRNLDRRACSGERLHQPGPRPRSTAWRTGDTQASPPPRASCSHYWRARTASAASSSARSRPPRRRST